MRWRIQGAHLTAVVAGVLPVGRPLVAPPGNVEVPAAGEPWRAPAARLQATEERAGALRLAATTIASDA